MHNEHKECLGHDVYVNLIEETQQLLLTTEEGFMVHSTILLRPEVYTALVRYVERMTKKGRLREGP